MTHRAPSSVYPDASTLEATGPVSSQVENWLWRDSCFSGRMQDKSELELITCSQHGDQQAVAELFRRHYSSSLMVARNLLRHSDESQDAVQMAYLLALRHLQTFRGDACFKTWISRIVVNCCLMHLRQTRRQLAWIRLDSDTCQLGPDKLTSRAPTPEKLTWCQEASSAVGDAVAKLPRRLREPYALYTISGLSLKEVAEAMGLTVPAVKTRIFRARAGVRSRLGPTWSDAHSSIAARPQA
jgi:RNA polymerase sigma-70 factor, ECF subfamily